MALLETLTQIMLGQEMVQVNKIYVGSVGEGFVCLIGQQLTGT